VLFPSPVFLTLFLPLVLGLVLLAGRRGRNAALLLASLFFYAWGEGRMVLVMLGSIAVNHAIGLQVERAKAAGNAKAWVAGAVAFNLLLLASFKYAAWVFGAEHALVAWFRVGHEGAPPIGISFFTFQALSYVVDVDRRDAPVQRDPLKFGLYIALFPQLVAGPIVRYRDVARQLVERTVSRPLFASGVRRFVLGLGKKVLLAGPLGTAADLAFGVDPGGLTAGAAWLGLVCYTLQIYLDFSAYSDMAIGLGRMFGFRFLENFDFPYVARSVTDFWRRWHVSLSSWFRDYLYIPLGGNRKGAARTYLNLWIVFLLCGLWHGASWTYVVWGAWHGGLLVAERAVGRERIARLPAVVGHAWTLLAVMAGWVLFRANGAEHAVGYFRALAGAGGAAYASARLVDGAVFAALACGLVGCVPWVRHLDAWLATDRGARLRPAFQAASVPALLLVLVVSLAEVAGGASQPFIYFRF
jgi:alginate O-acetyltransferase complex protein AlgI